MGVISERFETQIMFDNLATLEFDSLVCFHNDKYNDKGVIHFS